MNLYFLAVFFLFSISNVMAENYVCEAYCGFNKVHVQTLTSLVKDNESAAFQEIVTKCENLNKENPGTFFGLLKEKGNTAEKATVTSSCYVASDLKNVNGDGRYFCQGLCIHKNGTDRPVNTKIMGDVFETFNELAILCKDNEKLGVGKGKAPFMSEMCYTATIISDQVNHTTPLNVNDSTIQSKDSLNVKPTSFSKDSKANQN